MAVERGLQGKKPRTESEKEPGPGQGTRILKPRAEEGFDCFYERLIDRGKEAKGALIAAARTLLVILNTMLKNQTAWQPDHSPATA